MSSNKWPAIAAIFSIVETTVSALIERTTPDSDIKEKILRLELKAEGRDEKISKLEEKIEQLEKDLRAPPPQ